MRFLLAIFLLAPMALAQAQNDTTVSPQVQADRRVTFRIRAPKASEVTTTAIGCRREHKRS